MAKRIVDANLDVELFRKVTASMHCFVADSASDEMRAATQLAGTSLVHTLSPDLPNMRVVVRDKAHAAQRNIKRLFKADPYLDTVNTTYIWSSTSPVRMLENFMFFKKILNEN